MAAPVIEPLISKYWGSPQSWTLDAYRKRGGYEGLKKALEMAPAAVIDEVKKSNLRGRGGAGFPTGLKWSFVPKDSPKPKYLAVNGDESEPGTFKDRYILELDPHMMLEGIAIAAWALGVHTCYVYLRGEFKFPAERCQAAIDEAYKAGIFGKKVLGKDFELNCYLVRGAGAYICGEETALLESLEGKKGWPRLKPPFPAVVGLFGCPTVVNNVETLASVPHVFAMGPEKYAKLGTDKSGGTRLVCLSGTVNRPGVYECSMHTTFNDLIFGDAYGRGLPNGRKVKAVIPGGSSAPVLSPHELGTAMEFEALKPLQSMAGSGGVIVMDDRTCMVRSLWRVARFYAEESCGQCTPCREGTPWQTRLLRKIEEGRADMEDLELLSNVATSIAPYPPIGLGNTICALGDAAALPTHSFLMRFRAEFEAHIHEKRCPFGDKPWGEFGEWS
ncbi:NADH-quinone oxidoreductase subunit NuoF [Aggregicoccus sp. 17bor-14]|uniref:NADH-quinone oxidoreductase subunit NuoF n=1 Tax=Myxococcaceae TaxID=31 RepID=UPI00129D1214|nr:MULTISPECIES: NADH-quinone oxidoreductase subunit NuoF [Myxococcaceae]MBF5045061.1 NADH-quinone oxidoreductase subunit NuoF [Simulacricoccus sp. 17bor-14]MRI90803.1 NADH-quinone oxidoreductase subunit NuoF [Aggregicoccus sp. 17bor-14]